MRIFSKATLNDTFFVLLFLPFWKILTGPRVQPIAVFCVLFLLLKKKTLHHKPFSIIVILLISIILSYPIDANYGLRNSILSVSVIFLPPIIYLGIPYLKGVYKISIIKILTLLFTGLALLQSVESLDFLFDPLRVLIPIGPSASISSYRGVSLLSPEPSNAAFIIATLMWFWHLSNEKIHIIYLLAIAILIVTNRSGTLVLLLLPYVLVNARKYSYFYISLSPLLILLVTTIEIRVFDVLRNLMNIFQTGLWRNTEYWYLVSGPRFVEVYIAYTEAFSNISGLGVGGVESSYTQILQSSGVSMGKYWNSMVSAGFFENSRPNSYFSYLAMTTGFLPVLCIIFILIRSVRYAPENLKVFGYFSIILLLFRGTITMPYPWIVLGTLLIRNDIYIDKPRSI